MEGLAACFADLKDPRSGDAGKHDLIEILVIALCAVMCGGETACDMAIFARERETFLREFLKLENGPPGHDTLLARFPAARPRAVGEPSTLCFRASMAKPRDEAACCADKAYDSAALRKALNDEGVDDKIAYKAKRNKPLVPWQKWSTSEAFSARADSLNPNVVSTPLVSRFCSLAPHRRSALARACSTQAATPAISGSCVVS